MQALRYADATACALQEKRSMVMAQWNRVNAITQAFEVVAQSSSRSNSRHDLSLCWPSLVTMALRKFSLCAPAILTGRGSVRRHMFFLTNHDRIVTKPQSELELRTAEQSLRTRRKVHRGGHQLVTSPQRACCQWPVAPSRTTHLVLHLQLSL